MNMDDYLLEASSMCGQKPTTGFPRDHLRQLQMSSYQQQLYKCHLISNNYTDIIILATMAVIFVMLKFSIKSSEDKFTIS